MQSKNILTKDIILSKTNQLQIILHFLKLKEIPRANISSPFTKDNNPSFKINSKEETYHCFSTGKHGDAFSLVAELYNLDCKNNFNQVLRIIQDDMFINNDNSFPIVKKKPIQDNNSIEETPFEIDDISKISFTDKHLEFWNKFGVSIKLLENYKVSAICEYSFFSKAKNKKLTFKIKENEIAFCYEINGRHEIYVPKQPSLKKSFCNGLLADDIFGFEQIRNSKVDHLIICAGKKDTLVAISKGFNAICFRSETHTLTKTQIKLIQYVSNQLLICYDNDTGGVNGVEKITSTFPEIINIKLPEKYNDLSDYFLENTTSNFQTIIDKVINKPEVSNEKYKNINLPQDIDEPISNFIDDIEKYNLFMAKNQIWIGNNNSKDKHFKSVSNFSMEIIQHMIDEKVPMKLIRIINIFNHEHIFDVPSDRLNTPMKLDEIITSYGNYQWKGSPKDFQQLRSYLFDKMGNGKKIDCLGWQNDYKFWVWNNHINLCNGNSLEIDSNGIFSYNKTSFYIPSANKIYKNNLFKYEPQKNFRILEAETTLESYLIKLLTVHRNHAITATLFTFSSLFQDIVVKEINGFPILFLQGKASSGKDQLSLCCQSFYGTPQASINVEAGVSTAKAHIREFAQFTNGICQFSEYKNGDKQLDGILKGIWDRNGYKRGKIESSVATESVPILSSLILTSNYYPDDEPLITRLLWLDMNKNEFTTEEINSYNELSDITSKGISSFGNEILNYRELFKHNFKELYRKNKEYLSDLVQKAPSRISTNYAILMATFEILSKKIHFPFTYNEMLQHFVKSIEFQLNKISSSSITNKWWDCFLTIIQTTNENRLEINKHYRIEENKLHFNFTNTYSRIQRQWYVQYKESIPNKSIIQEALKKDKSFIETKASYRFSTGKDGINTSAYVIDVNFTNVSDEIKNVIETLSCLIY
ncbi:CHC2 zinc finger domain-containing protein [Flavobacterium sp. N2270]|uniref:CHC2 zinc finger domain-containing protein n=1 Tax=Flavobacterium sp. N2270 TaxID=2986831 RepID=UPI0022258116|nr:CHC2 zinc finger domain-containing protein [Flavobacterium sp. N2270]